MVFPHGCPAKSHALTSVKGLWDKMRWLGDSDDVYPALATGRVGPEAACSRARSRLDCRKSSRFEAGPAVGTAQPCISIAGWPGGPFLAVQLAWTTRSCAPGFACLWPRASCRQAGRWLTRSFLAR